MARRNKAIVDLLLARGAKALSSDDIRSTEVKEIYRRWLKAQETQPASEPEITDSIGILPRSDERDELPSSQRNMDRTRPDNFAQNEQDAAEQEQEQEKKDDKAEESERGRVHDNADDERNLSDVPDMDNVESSMISQNLVSRDSAPEVGVTGDTKHKKFSPTSPALAEITQKTAEDYGDNGYGYMNPSDLVPYDLGQIQRLQNHRGRRGSLDSATVGASIGPREDDKVHRPLNFIERSPPPSRRGFDRIPLPSAKRVDNTIFTRPLGVVEKIGARGACLDQMTLESEGLLLQ